MTPDRTVTAEDAAFVLNEVRKISHHYLSVGFSASKTTTAQITSKAISVWFFRDMGKEAGDKKTGGCDHRLGYEDSIRPGNDYSIPSSGVDPEDNSNLVSLTLPFSAPFSRFQLVPLAPCSLPVDPLHIARPLSARS